MSSPQPTRRRHRARPSLATLIGRIAAVLVPETPDLEEALMNDSDVDNLFHDLRDRVERDNGRSRPRDRAQQFERLQAALPEAMRLDLTRYDDLMAEQEIAVREAAYMVGVAVGRRMAGVR